MPINIEYPELTNPDILFHDVGEANEFFGALEVPDATEDQFGVIKKAEKLTALPSITYVDLQVINEAGAITVTQVPSKASFDVVYNSYNALLEKLKLAGIMTE